MKKFRRVLALLTVFAMAVSVFTAAGVFAADDEMGNPEFLFGEVKADPNSTWTFAGDSDLKISAETWTNEPFASGYTRVAVPSATSDDVDGYFKVSREYYLNTSAIFGPNYKIKKGDVIYFSYYYKADSEFEYNGTTYTDAKAPNLEMYVGRHKYGSNSGNIGNVRTPLYNIRNIEPGRKRILAKAAVKPDGQWHKGECAAFVSADDNGYINTTGSLNISFVFSKAKAPYRIMIAEDFTVGLMHFDSSKYTDETADTYVTAARGAEYLCRTLEATKPDIKTISTDGYIIKTENEFEEGIDTGIKKTEYTVTVSSDNPTIKMSNDEGGSLKKAFSADITKANGNNIVKACAPTYNKANGGETVRYVKIGNLNYTEPALGVDDINATYADEINPAEYSETFTFNYDTDYRVFDPDKARHSVGKKEAKNAIVKFTGDTVEKQDIADDTFTQAYVMELIKNSEYTGNPLTINTDDNFFQFEYNVGDYGKKGDIMAFSFYIKNESESGTNPAKRLVITGNENAASDRWTSPSNSYAIENENMDSLSNDGKWVRAVYLSNINEKNGSIPTTQWLRISIAADGSQDNKIYIAEPKCTVIKRAEVKYPEAEFRTNDARRRIAGEYLAKTADISAVTVYENTVEVPSGQTSVTVKGREANINKITPVSKNGDIPFTITNKGNGEYEITPVAIGYNKVDSTKGFKQGVRRNKYVYDGTPDSAFIDYDYEKGLTSVVTMGGSNYNNNTKTIKNSAMTGSPLTLITELDENVSVTFKKDGAAVSAGNYASEPEGSAYSLTVSGNYFLSVYKLMLAAYTEDGALVATSPAVGFRKNAATATISGLKNDGTLKFKAFVWEGFTPITQAAEINANVVGIPVIIR